MKRSNNISFRGLTVLVFWSLWFLVCAGASHAGETAGMTRGEFIQALAQHKPEHPFLPKKVSHLSPQALYDQTVAGLNAQGITVLDGKPMEGVLTDLEMIQVTYAFAGAPIGASLIDQKLFLKRTGILKTSDVALATGVRGKVLQRHEGEKNIQPVELASALFMNDRIKTASQAQATFTFDDKSRVTLSGNSLVKVDKHIYDPDQRFRQTVIRVAKGMARFAVTKGMKAGSSFTVITPYGVAGVRGTEFVAIVDPDKTRFVVTEGKIETAPLLPNGTMGRSVFIKPGQMQELFRNGRTSRVRKAPRELLQHIREKTRRLDGPGPRKQPVPNRKNFRPNKERMTQLTNPHDANILKARSHLRDSVPHLPPRLPVKNPAAGLANARSRAHAIQSLPRPARRDVFQNLRNRPANLKR